MPIVQAHYAWATAAAISLAVSLATAMLLLAASTARSRARTSRAMFRSEARRKTAEDVLAAREAEFNNPDRRYYELLSRVVGEMTVDEIQRFNVGDFASDARPSAS